jgi:hypothetical protein
MVAVSNNVKKSNTCDKVTRYGNSHTRAKLTNVKCAAGKSASGAKPTAALNGVIFLPVKKYDVATRAVAETSEAAKAWCEESPSERGR